jgi:hypothetical protein
VSVGCVPLAQEKMGFIVDATDTAVGAQDVFDQRGTTSRRSENENMALVRDGIIPQKPEVSPEDKRIPHRISNAPPRQAVAYSFG